MHLRAARHISNDTLLFAQCDPSLASWAQPIGPRSQDNEALFYLLGGSPDILGLINIGLKLLQSLIPSSGIVL